MFLSHPFPECQSITPWPLGSHPSLYPSCSPLKLKASYYGESNNNYLLVEELLSVWSVNLTSILVLPDLKLRTLLKALRMRKSDPTVNEFLRRNADTIPRPD